VRSSARCLGAMRDATVSVMGRVTARRRIRISGRVPLKVNLGSGLTVAPGWVNLDASLNTIVARLPRAVQRAAYSLSGSCTERSWGEYLRILSANDFVFCDLRRGIPLADGTVDFLFASHILEHLEREQASALAREALRVAKAGAVFRVVVPDLDRFVAMYQAGERRKAVDGIFSAGALGALSRHRYMYDERGLRELLEEAGFTSIVRRRAGEGLTPDLDVLDTRVDESLYVEARR